MKKVTIDKNAQSEGGIQIKLLEYQGKLDSKLVRLHFSVITTFLYTS